MLGWWVEWKKWLRSQYVWWWFGFFGFTRMHLILFPTSTWSNLFLIAFLSIFLNGFLFVIPRLGLVGLLGWIIQSFHNFVCFASFLLTMVLFLIKVYCRDLKCFYTIMIKLLKLYIITYYYYKLKIKSDENKGIFHSLGFGIIFFVKSYYYVLFRFILFMRN